MKKIFALCALLFALCAAGGARAATSWWLQPTICKPNPATCYASMGIGFESGMWDATGNCWGLKIVCGEALTPVKTSPVEMGKTTIAAGTGINADFDTSMLNGDCFGARKTQANGSMASVNGTFVKVWCNGILDNPSETLATGEIQFGTQPNCKDLAKNGFIAVLNQKCYGKYFAEGDYYIECAGTNELPTRIVRLNGASQVVGTTAGSYNYPQDLASAKTIFDTMQSVSAAKRAENFEN